MERAGVDLHARVTSWVHVQICDAHLVLSLTKALSTLLSCRKTWTCWFIVHETCSSRAHTAMGKLVLVQLTSGIDEAIVLAHAWQPGMRPLLPAVLQLHGAMHHTKACVGQCECDQHGARSGRLMIGLTLLAS